MAWTYPTLPVSIQLPPCPECLNRGRVTQVARHTYVCTDCAPARVFVAVFVAERPLALETAAGLERVS